MRHDGWRMATRAVSFRKFEHRMKWAPHILPSASDQGTLDRLCIVQRRKKSSPTPKDRPMGLMCEGARAPSVRRAFCF